MVIDDSIMFLGSLMDCSSSPNDYPGLEKIVDRILGSTKGRFDRVMFCLQGDYIYDSAHGYFFALPDC